MTYEQSDQHLNKDIIQRFLRTISILGHDPHPVHLRNPYEAMNRISLDAEAGTS